MWPFNWLFGTNGKNGNGKSNGGGCDGDEGNEERSSDPIEDMLQKHDCVSDGIDFHAERLRELSEKLRHQGKVERPH